MGQFADAMRRRMRDAHGVRRPLLAAAAVAFACGAATSAAAPPVALLTGVRAQPAKVIFTFRSAPSQISYGYVTKAQLREDGSGRAVAVKGTAFVVVHFTPASGADLSGSTFKLVYRGPKRLKPAARGPVQEVVRTGDFESILSWTIGLDKRRPFHVVRSGAKVTVTVG
jgi:hypothetical protein